ncbi:D-glycero-beta-D-manno-heptose 1,7-bisphosphate 7-phosphatase [Methanoregula sp. UBA64]|jgi:D-glycero-D-manno-heptose 1,7-bisphosphate phosphatase|uniref:D-glycero-beta-D-manno-heptose 1,7-bisphosphate 7-phosphatase n=1 Tax=Methanoregula sp. UBA64 TaxID=1915554 RepID=UPI0025DBDF71|nr:D-glycero-beta-D-manno-heptose 1,7-bisphosphate 7-phosphatase [Methanoregula sp. UBA64]
MSREIHTAVFLDRDGVINQDPPHYAHRIDQLIVIKGSGIAIKMLNDAGFMVIVVTNQSGVAKGMYEEADIRNFNNEMMRRLGNDNARIDAIYYCPHHPDAVVQKYRIECECRKPKPGLLLEAGMKFGIDFSASFLVGDKWSDVEAGRQVGCRTSLVMTGHGYQEYVNNQDNTVDYVATDLLDAVENFILKTKR